MSLLRWRTAVREDRDAFRQFSCTAERHRVRLPWGWGYDHPADHELDVQAMIRDRLKPAGEPNRTVLVGMQADAALGAVSTYRALGSASFNIDLIAIAVQHRGRGGGVAREALSTSLDYITADADGDGFSIARVAAHVHEKNRPSQRLFGSQGFEHTANIGDKYQLWSADFEIGGTLPF